VSLTSGDYLRSITEAVARVGHGQQEVKDRAADLLT
jgi:hypothetical protein